jgi:hypothetical protein
MPASETPAQEEPTFRERVLAELECIRKEAEYAERQGFAIGLMIGGGIVYIALRVF